MWIYFLSNVSLQILPHELKICSGVAEEYVRLKLEEPFFVNLKKNPPLNPKSEQIQIWTFETISPKNMYAGTVIFADIDLFVSTPSLVVDIVQGAHFGFSLPLNLGCLNLII